MNGAGEDFLAIDCGREAGHISSCLRSMLAQQLHRRGLVVAISGGIDSSVCAALAVRALGPDKVFGLMMPERDSAPESLQRGLQLARYLGIEYRVEDIAPVLEAIGCYRWRDEAIRSVFSDYGPGWKNKIVIAGGLEGRINHFKLVVEDPDGRQQEQRLSLQAFLTIVAATNHKQRVRKTLEYFHADRLNYAVVGTPNKLEHDQGFFVKNGDGSADIKPIAHLYKSQVYALGNYLGLPASICEAVPTTDTYSLPQGQDEFYFALPYQQMDVALWCRDHGKTAAQAAECLGISETQAVMIYRDIDNKRNTTRYLHAQALLIEPMDDSPLRKVAHEQS